MALGSDGGGSIRYPSALTGLCGVKTQRGRIQLSPDHLDLGTDSRYMGPDTKRRRRGRILDATANDGNRVPRTLQLTLREQASDQPKGIVMSPGRTRSESGDVMVISPRSF